MLALSGLFAAAASTASIPATDAPYCETAAVRFTAAGLPTVAGWPALPVANVTQVLPLQDGTALLVAADGSLYQSSGHASEATFKPLPLHSGSTAGSSYLVIPPSAATARRNRALPSAA